MIVRPGIALVRRFAFSNSSAPASFSLRGRGNKYRPRVPYRIVAHGRIVHLPVPGIGQHGLASCARVGTEGSH